jgi:hypothetical protein
MGPLASLAQQQQDTEQETETEQEQETETETEQLETLIQSNQLAVHRQAASIRRMPDFKQKLRSFLAFWRSRPANAPSVDCETIGDLQVAAPSPIQMEFVDTDGDGEDGTSRAPVPSPTRTRLGKWNADLDDALFTVSKSSR